jgi:L-ascorbate metabolism protein UlaG (beta-lactamase superfamily)
MSVPTLPILQDDLFLADVHSASTDEDEALHLWWLGQSGFLVAYQGAHLLLDPYLSDSLTEQYADTDSPHLRLTGRVVAPERLDFVDVVTSSHNHTDHLDPDTLCPLMAANPGITVVVPRANLRFAANRLEVEPSRLTPIAVGQPVSHPPFTLHAVPAAHKTLMRDSHGFNAYLGYVVEAGPWTLYHSGDTLLYDGLAEKLQSWQIDVAILPINGRSPERQAAGNLTGEEAAALAHQVGAGLAIPCHYDMFAFNTASTDQFIQTARRLNQPYVVLKNGGRWIGHR